MEKVHIAVGFHIVVDDPVEFVKAAVNEALFLGVCGSIQEAKLMFNKHRLPQCAELLYRPVYSGNEIAIPGCFILETASDILPP